MGQKTVLSGALHSMEWRDAMRRSKQTDYFRKIIVGASIAGPAIVALIVLVLSNGSAAAGPVKGDIRTNRLGMKFAYIPPGEFMMGSKGEVPEHVSDRTPHKVFLTRGFYMQTTEVTQGQWRAVMGAIPSFFTECGDDCPVDKASWDDAQAFLKALNRMEAPSVYRLPTEAEWEYAARSGGNNESYAGGEDPGAAGWCRDSSGDHPHPAGQKAPNGFGLYDMTGNVWEWCHDWYSKNYYKISPLENPDGPLSGEDRVIRGGSWIDFPGACRVTFRYWHVPAYQDYSIGLRLVLEAGP